MVGEEVTEHRRIREEDASSEAGFSLVEVMVGIGLMVALMGLAFNAQLNLTSDASINSSRAYVVARVRGAMEGAARVLRDQAVLFNTVPATPLGVNFDLSDINGPVVRDGILFYFDSKGMAELYDTGAGLPATAGLSDLDGDGKADVMGIGLVRQNLNLRLNGLGNNGYQDFIDLNHDGLADDVDQDGNRDPLWTLTMVRFGKIADATDPVRWRQGRVLTANVYIRKILATGTLTDPNIRLFQFSAHNSLAMGYDEIADGGNANGVADENEIGNITTADGIINDANEISAIDSITISLNTVELVSQVRGGLMAIRADITSDLITPRPRLIMRRNGMVGAPDPTLAANIK